jgi:hypothetical protein
LSRLTAYDSLGKPHWELLFTVHVPAIPGSTLVTVDCSLDGQPSAAVVALGTWSADTLKDIQRAWVGSPLTERIDSVDAHRVSCSYDGDRD